MDKLGLIFIGGLFVYFMMIFQQDYEMNKYWVLEKETSVFPASIRLLKQVKIYSNLQECGADAKILSNNYKYYTYKCEIRNSEDSVLSSKKEK
jgi:hypothetical protein